MSAIAVPVQRGLSTLLPQIGKFFSNFGKAAAPAAKSAVTTVTKKATIPASTISRNVAITSAGIFGSTLASTLFLSTPAGQNTVSQAGQSIGQITDLGQSVNKLFTNNPILPIGLLILGGLVVVSVIKK